MSIVRIHEDCRNGREGKRDGHISRKHQHVGVVYF
jgi:hypothetical protein